MFCLCRVKMVVVVVRRKKWGSMCGFFDIQRRLRQLQWNNKRQQEAATGSGNRNWQRWPTWNRGIGNNQPMTGSKCKLFVIFVFNEKFVVMLLIHIHHHHCYRCLLGFQTSRVLLPRSHYHRCHDHQGPLIVPCSIGIVQVCQACLHRA